VGLDPLEAERLRQSVSALRDVGTAILLTSHYLTDIERLSERVVILQRGRVTHDLPLEDLLKRAGAAAEVTVTSMEPLVAAKAEGRDGVRLLETVPGPPSKLRFEVRDWNPRSLGALASLWPAGKITDVHVQPLSLEHVFAELARGEDDGV
jgi:ABC-2 type transport system ATP-binding protein